MAATMREQPEERGIAWRRELHAQKVETAIQTVSIFNKLDYL